MDRRLIPALVALLPLFVGRAYCQTPAEADVLLESMVRLSGVSGREGTIRNWILAEINNVIRVRSMEGQSTVNVDSSGNIVLEIGKGPLNGLFMAHMDEVGFMVDEVTDNRVFLRVLGEVHPELYVGRTVYLDSEVGRNALLLTSVLPDGRLEAWSGIEDSSRLTEFILPGASGTLRKEYFRMGGRRRMGRSMDDRVGCAALIMAIRHLDTDQLSGRVAFAWTVEKETTLRGATALAEYLKPALVFPVDAFLALDNPLESESNQNLNLGGGASVHIPATASPEARQLKEVIRSSGITSQFGEPGIPSEGEVFFNQGVSGLILGWPLRYSHSPVDLIDLQDLVSLAKIVRLTAESLPTTRSERKTAERSTGNEERN